MKKSLILAFFTVTILLNCYEMERETPTIFSYTTDPFLLSIIRLESGFDSKCRNPDSSAFGLGQLLYPTLLWISHKRYSLKEHYSLHPSLQIYYMNKYVEYLSNKYNGDKRKILKEYSGGAHGYFDNYYKIVMKDYRKRLEHRGYGEGVENMYERVEY